MAEGKVCSVAWQRQHTHHQHLSTKVGIKQAAQGGETLPVVELKPFTKKVWRREKSLPNFYEKPTAKEEAAGSESTRHAARSQGPSPNIVRYIHELSEQHKSTDSRQSVDSTQRYRSNLHPKADFHFDGCGVTEHQQDLIPSFITRTERTRTTIGEDGGVATTTITDMSSMASERPVGGILGLARESSNLMSAYTRDKRLQQGVVLTGGRLPVTNLGRRHLTYLSPYAVYKQKQQTWNAMRNENTPSSATTDLSPRNAANLPMSPRNTQLMMGSSSANGHHVTRRDMMLSGSSFYGAESGVNNSSLQLLRQGQRPTNKFNSKLGAAQDSLLLLSQRGAPTVLERVLSYDQEVRLERCRRERSFAAVGETNVLSTAHYVAYDSHPTRGEMTLMKARVANTSRDGVGKATGQGYKRYGLQKPTGHLSGHQQHGYSHFKMARIPLSDHSNSPRSTKSELGDSGIMSSPGEHSDHADLLIPPQPPPSLLGPLNDVPIPELPGELEEGGEQQLQMWAPDESVVYLDYPDHTRAQSSDPYRRPLSDTAADEALLLRNEQATMSADNRARKLPRKYSEHSNTTRTVASSSRKTPAGKEEIKDANQNPQSKFGADEDNTENTDAKIVDDDEEDNDDNADVKFPEQGESRSNRAFSKTTDSGRYKAGADSAKREEGEDVESVSVNSTAPSFAPPERAREPDDSSFAVSAVVQECQSKPQQSGEKPEVQSDDESPRTSSSTGSDSSVGQIGLDQDLQIAENAKQDNHDNLPGHKVVKQDDSSKRDAQEPAVVSGSDSETHVSKGVLPLKNSNSKSETEDPNQRPSDKNSDSLKKSLDQVYENDVAEDAQDNAKSSASEIDAASKLQDSISANVEGNSKASNEDEEDSESKKVVEKIVTVTIEVGSTTDHFDKSKTFLTTSNLETDEFKNIVKV